MGEGVSDNHSDDKKTYICDPMGKTIDVIIKKGLLKWLMKATLVFGLITFSGHISDFKSYNSEPTKTELRETSKTNFKRTVCFKKISDGLSCLFSQTSNSQTDNFTSCLVQYETNIKVKLKRNIQELPTITNQDKHFLICYPSDNSEEFETDRSRG